MLFRSSILSALYIGLVSGLVLCFCQFLMVNPILFSAEKFETDASAAVETIQQKHHDHHTHLHDEHQGHENHHEAVDGHEGHHHDPNEWSPEDGAERAGYTILSNILAGIGFSAILIAIMSQMHIQEITQIKPIKGIFWGTAGFITFFAGPSIGLPPEIPGIEAAQLENRQFWWLFTATSIGVGLMLLAFGAIKHKAFSLALFILPYFLLKAPNTTGPAFTHPDPEAVAALTELHQQFIVASGVTNLLFWLVLGSLSTWAVSRIDLPQHQNSIAAQ